MSIILKLSLKTFYYLSNSKYLFQHYRYFPYSFYNQIKLFSIPIYKHAKFMSSFCLHALSQHQSYLKTLMTKETICLMLVIFQASRSSQLFSSLPCSCPVSLTSEDCVTQAPLPTGFHLGLASGRHQQEIPKWNRRESNMFFFMSHPCFDILAVAASLQHYSYPLTTLLHFRNRCLHLGLSGLAQDDDVRPEVPHHPLVVPLT